MAVNFLVKTLLCAVLMYNAVLATDTALECPPATVCYAIDESASISATEFKQQTNALSVITREFDKLSPNSTYAAVGFAKVASVIQEPTTNLITFLTALQTNSQSGGGTSLGSGLQACHELLRPMPDPRVIVLITDGMDRIAPLGMEVDDDIKAEGITIATIGVGEDVDEAELKEIATSEDLYRSIDNYADFTDSIAKIVRLLCKAIPSMSASPTASASYELTPSVPASVDPSPSSGPSVPDERRRCTIVQCGQCGRELECYVNSGSGEFDSAVTRVIQTKAKFCTWKRWFTECGQICGRTTKVNCMFGKSFPPSRGRSSKRVSYRCASKGHGRYSYMSSIASYKVCIKSGVTTISCVMSNCGRGEKGLRCDSTC